MILQDAEVSSMFMHGLNLRLPLTLWTSYDLAHPHHWQRFT